MQVNDDLEVVLLRPGDCLAEVWQLPLDVRLATGDVPSPIAYGQANVVQARSVIVSSSVTLTRAAVVVQNYEKAGNEWKGSGTHPAAAMSLKSCSVIQVSQWTFRRAAALALSWYCP